MRQLLLQSPSVTTQFRVWFVGQRQVLCGPRAVFYQAVAITLIVTLLCCGSRAEDTTPPPTAIKRQIPWQNSRVTGRPEPPTPFRPELAFPKLGFELPVTLTNAPQTDRLFLVEVRGKILSFPEDQDCDSTDLFLDLREVDPAVTQVYGMTFHPQYPAKPYVYVVYVLKNKDPKGTIVSRFTVDSSDPPRADPSSERQLIRWLAGGHNGSCLKFGPDGYLYISTGDGEGPNPPDILRAGQDLTNVLSTVMRIDVDRADAGRNYAIPPDNPFLHLAEARPEIYAFGFRNPWKFSFDRQTGDLWLGDVGWDMWELVFRVTRGGNYGWSIMEGSNPIHPTEKQGPGPIIPPIVEHHHSEARSITGGFVYRGNQHPELRGAYVYGDYNTGKIWALRSSEDQVTQLTELTDTSHQIIGWCETNRGELYYADYQRTNQIYRLVRNDVEDRSANFPRKLSETGLFDSTDTLTPSPGVVAYDVNAAMWEDGAHADRLLAVPGAGQIAPDKQRNWSFPEDSVAVRTVSREIDGVLTRLETQVLHFDQNEWRPYSYVWNEDQSDAVLAPTEGTKVQFGSYEHRVASRVECRICHTKPMRGVLGVRADQLSAGTLDDWREMGLLKPAPANANSSVASQSESRKLRKLVDPYDVTHSLDDRARSYLHVNCVSCHRPGGGGPSPIHLDFAQDIDATQLIDCQPVQGDFRLPDAQIVTPGLPMQSILFYRMAKVGSGHMPHIGAKQVDPEGLRLIHDWIQNLQADSSPERSTPVELTTTELATTKSATNELATARIRELLKTSQGTLQLAWWMHDAKISAELKQRVVDEALASDAMHVRDLLEPFYPASEVKVRLGTGFDVREVLSLVGDSARGAKVFRQKSLQCVNCHDAGNARETAWLGPSLAKIGTKYRTAEEMLETIVAPSAKIAPEYQMLIILTTGGETISGRVLEEDDDKMTLMGADRKIHEIAFEQIDSVNASEVSLMPAELLQSLSAQEAADLVAYLLSLTDSAGP